MVQQRLSHNHLTVTEKLLLPTFDEAKQALKLKITKNAKRKKVGPFLHEIPEIKHMCMYIYMYLCLLF